MPDHSNSAKTMGDRRWFAIATAAYALLVLCMFGDLLVRGDLIASAAWTSDTRSQFFHLRDFGFSELARGNVPLWNPHIFCGTAYAANFQAALFYPPNWIFLLLPTARAINVSFALHCFLMGLFTYIWLRGRRLHPVASLTGGAVLMLCGPYFAFVYAGNLSNICTMVWAPLILRAVDGVLSAAKVPWGLIGAAAVALQILAGHPQYAYNTALAASLYFLFLLPRSRQRGLAQAVFLGMYFGGAMLSAIQLFPGLVSAEQSVRAGTVPYEFASHLSLPPENLVTLLAPNFFGGSHRESYWGKAVFWEMNGFFSVTGLLLAFYGVVFGARESDRIVLALLVLAMLLLALGAYTPLHWPLYNLLPGFGSFRGSAKFLFPATLFLTALMAIGFDAILRESSASSRLEVRVGRDLGVWETSVNTEVSHAQEVYCAADGEGTPSAE